MHKVGHESKMKSPENAVPSNHAVVMYNMFTRHDAERMISAKQATNKNAVQKMSRNASQALS